ncbi:MAG: inositol monophosphatase [Alphaproteobacteria bacterium]
MVINPDQIAEIILECVESYILPRYKVLESHEISSKSGPNDLVTQADLDVEAHLSRVLPGLLPGSLVVGEEGVSQGAVSLDALHQTERPVWVVDPVDGTYNFVHGRPGFGVMLACIVNGEIQAGWIYEIIGQNMLIAERGSGAFGNGERLAVDRSADIPQMQGHMSLKFFPPDFREPIKAAAEAAHIPSITPICCASEYLRIATGRSHFSLYNRLKPWDHMAGILIAREAGAHVAKWDATPPRASEYDVGLLVAPDEEKWHALHKIFIEPLEAL